MTRSLARNLLNRVDKEKTRCLGVAPLGSLLLIPRCSQSISASLLSDCMSLANFLQKVISKNFQEHNRLDPRLRSMSRISLTKLHISTWTHRRGPRGRELTDFTRLSTDRTSKHGSVRPFHLSMPHCFHPDSLHRLHLETSSTIKQGNIQHPT